MRNIVCNFNDFDKSKLIPGKTLLYYKSLNNYYKYIGEDEDWIYLEDGHLHLSFSKDFSKRYISQLYICE